ncbi:hypothetical protein OF83DRAFT_1125905 [Amylostereum chailletii]|nr:hypothetical protein OF83DRAFT_1125905 [Amylostereum chailletii]
MGDYINGIPLAVQLAQGHGFPRIGIFKKEDRFFVSVTVDKTSRITAISEENETFDGMVAQASSVLVVEVYAKRTIVKNKLIGGFEIFPGLGLAYSKECPTRTFGVFGHEPRTGSASLKLIITRPPGARFEQSAIIQENREQTDALLAIKNIQEALTSSDVSGRDRQQAKHPRRHYDYSDVWKPFLGTIPVCVNLADGIVEIPAYAKFACSVLFYSPRFDPTPFQCSSCSLYASSFVKRVMEPCRNP